MKKISNTRRYPIVRLCLVRIIVAALFCSIAAPPLVYGHQALLPNEESVKKIVRETLMDFAVAVKDGDFTLFHSRMSKQLKSEITAQEMKASFRSFVDQNIDLTGVEVEEPVFSQPPFLDADGWLVVEGTYEIYPHATDFSLQYVHESQRWKLVGIDMRVEPIPSSHPSTGKLPPESEVARLVGESLLDFAKAVNARDFTGFHAKCAVDFQRQFSPEGFAAAFKQFSDQGIDLTVLEGHEPEYSEAPAINDSGLLVVRGRYAVAPYSVPFELKYLFEGTTWKLFGIDLNVMPLSTSADDAERALAETNLEDIVNRSMMRFATAVNAGDFSAFYAGISRIWRDQITEEELTEIFGAFIENEIDLTPVGKLQPSFATKPYLDENDVLRLEGAYPTQPSVVRFKLSFVLEEGDWKLIGVNVQIE